MHSELRASVDAKVQAAVKEALAQVARADPLESSFERRCLLITDDADLVEISSVFNRFP